MRSIRLAAVLLLAVAPPLAAQDEGDIAAYFALSFTPVGALPPNPIGADLAKASRRFDVLYGRLDFGFAELNNFGFAYSEQSGTGRVGLRAGAVTADEGGNEILMGGLEFERVLGRRQQADGSTMSIGLLPTVGVAHALDSESDAFFLSASLGLPLVYAAGEQWRVAFFVVPGAGYGRITGDGDGVQGVRPMLGAGMRASAPGGTGLVLGVQNVFIEEGDATIGLGITVALGGAASTRRGAFQRR